MEQLPQALLKVDNEIEQETITEDDPCAMQTCRSRRGYGPEMLSTAYRLVKNVATNVYGLKAAEGRSLVPYITLARKPPRKRRARRQPKR